MASIRPFLGLRYNSNCGNIDSLTAPPYDVLSQEERDEYAARDPHNIVHVTLPEQKSDDRSKYVKYARSSALLTEWRNDGSLVREGKPAIYRYTQTFTLPGFPEPFKRTSIVALIKVEPYENGVVLPHEQTFPKHKEDRLRILEATRAHVECIFGLYEDPDCNVLDAVTNAPVEEKVVVHSDDGVTQEFEPITDEASLSALAGLLADKKVWIADGHHRYETAVTFRQNLGPREGIVAEDYMMMALCSISDPGLVLLPTHRILKSLNLSSSEILERLKQQFQIEATDRAQLIARIEALKAEGKRAFGVVLAGGDGYVLTESCSCAIKDLIDLDGSDSLKDLDVTVLHQVILEKLLNIVGLDRIGYTRDPDEAIHAVDHGAAASFLMNPPSVDDMKTIALAGEKMPQKSTYYYPKVLSGLVMWSLNDF